MDRNKQHETYLRAHILRSRWYKVFIAAAAIVVFITTYMLILPAITLDAKCGKEEHKHAEACYEISDKLICKQAEQEGHIHSEECYQTTDELICGLEESEPVVEEVVNEETGETEQKVVSEGHTHDENCYTQKTELICEKEECEGHTHTKDCYKEDKSLKCDKDEHTHTDSCYHEQSDPNADVENEAIWTQTFANVTLTGDWGKDVAAIAETQVGYKESTKNFVYDKDDEKDGYTRYGAWYGDTYGEWCAMFASFCINYAQVGYDADGLTIPLESNCENWIYKLQQIGYYHTAGATLYMDQLGRETYTGDEYFLKPGDLIFFNLDQSQYVVSDHVGIVTGVTDNKITTIQGNSNGSVLEKTYNVGDPTIVGFGQIPENPNYVDPANKDQKKDSEEKSEKAAKAEKSDKKADDSKRVTTTKADDEEEAEVLESDESVATATVAYADGTATDMTNYVTGITVKKDNGGSWQTSTEFNKGESMRVEMNFSIPANVVTVDNPSIAYTFPKGLLPEGTAMNGDIYDGDRAVGTYAITTDSEGVSTIVLTYNSDFADGNAFTGSAFFTAEAALGNGQSKAEYSFPGTGTSITVKSNETPYDLSVVKSGSKSSDGKTIDYVVDITTIRGTDGQVTVTDSIYGGYPGDGQGAANYQGTVTIEKYDSTGTLVAGATESKTVSGDNFEFDLPELQAGESYKVKYTVDVDESKAENAGKLSVKNYASGKLKDHPDYSRGDYEDVEISKTKIEKYGSYNQITGQMDWTITINNPDKLDLSGNEVVDVVTENDIDLISGPVIKDAAENTITGGTTTAQSGKQLFTYKFPEGSTAEKYTITYSTTAPEANGTAVNNTATYKRDGSRDYSAPATAYVNHRSFGLTKSGWGSSTASGLDKYEWQTNMDLPDGNFPASGYFYEDTIIDATKGNSTFEDTHYGIKSEIENKIHGSFNLTVVENGKAVDKNWSAATSEYVDVEIKYYTEKGGTEVTDDSQEIGYFTVKVTPKNGKSFSASKMYFNYVTTGLTTGFTEGQYTYHNLGQVGDITSEPGQNKDMGTVNPSKQRVRESSDSKGEKVEWQASVDLPKSSMISEGYLFEDQLQDAYDSSGTSYPGTHYGTVSEIQSKIEETFRMSVDGTEYGWTDATTNYVDVQMKFYKTENGEKVETTSDDDQVNYFTVKVIPKSGKNFSASYVRFNYETRVNKNGINGGFITYKNELKVAGKEASATYSKRFMTQFEKRVFTGKRLDGEPRDNPSDNIYVDDVWEYVEADYDREKLPKYVFESDGAEARYDDGIITYRILINIGKDPSDDKELTILDYIPEGMEFTGNVYGANVFFNTSYLEREKFDTSTCMGHSSLIYNGSGNYRFSDHLHGEVLEGNQLKITLDAGYLAQDTDFNQSQGWIAIYYQLRITDPAWNSATTTKKTYVNEATWEQTGKGDSQETTVVRPVEEVSKTATPNADGRGNVHSIDYNIVINPACEDLDPEAESLELEDTLNPGNGTATMKLESIVLYEYSDTAEDHCGAAINTSRYQYHYDEASKKLTLVIPDELACVLKYTYDVSAGSSSKDYKITNEVNLRGKTYKSNEVEMKKQDSGAVSTKSTISLYKVDKDNYGKRLANVQFGLSYYGIQYGSFNQGWQTVGTYTTNADGKILLSTDTSGDVQLYQNFMYRLVETSNPNKGYAVDSTPYYFVWLDDANTADSWYTSPFFMHGDVAKEDIHFFTTKGGSIYIENEYKEIAVKKVWVDEDGKDLTNHPSDVTVKLYESTKRRDTVTVTINFVNDDGSISKTLTKTVARGSGIKVSGWTQTADSDVTVSPECSCEVYQFNNQWTSGSYVQLDSIQSDTTVTIKQGRALVPQYGAYDYNNEWKTSFRDPWGNTITLNSWDVGKTITVCKDNSTETYNITVTSRNVIAGAEWNTGNATIADGSYIDESEAGYIVEEGTVVDTVTLNASNNWEKVWGDDDSDYKLKADKYYYVKETAIGGQDPSQTKYTVFYRNNGGIKTGEIVITNRIPKEETPPETTTISIDKKWVDSSDNELKGDALNGKSATFRLMQVVNNDVEHATQYDTFTLSNDSGWSKEYSGIPKTTYDAAGNATHYKYYFEEITNSTTEATYQKQSFWNFLPFVNGSENATDAVIDEGTVTVTNKVLPEYTTVSVEKKWKNADGTDMDTTKLASDVEVKVDLYKVTNGELPGTKVNDDPYTLKASEWKVTVSDLIKTDYSNGEKISYTYYFKEQDTDAVAGYKKTYTNGTTTIENPDTTNISISAGTYTVINTEKLTTSVTVSKNWFRDTDGKVEDITSEQTGSIKFNIYQLAVKDGESAPAADPTSSTIPESAVKLNGDTPLQLHAGDEKTWTWSATYDAEVGYQYYYYVEEVDASGNWTITYDGQGSNALTIKNTKTVETYSLPHTGGMGTRLITMLGILLMAAASGLMILKKHRKEENW